MRREGFSPLFRHTASFLRAAVAAPAAESLAELAHDYPDVQDTGTPAEHDADRAVVAAYREQLAIQATLSEQDADEVLQMFFAFSILQLTPRADLETLLPFLDDPNPWIQERAALVLGAHAYAPAHPALERLATGQGNGALAARGVLASWPSSP